MWVLEVFKNSLCFVINLFAISPALSPPPIPTHPRMRAHAKKVMRCSFCSRDGSYKLVDQTEETLPSSLDFKKGDIGRQRKAREAEVAIALTKFVDGQYHCPSFYLLASLQLRD